MADLVEIPEWDQVEEDIVHRREYDPSGRVVPVRYGLMQR